MIKQECNHEDIPTHLYKYMRIGSNMYDDLRNHSLFLSSLSNENDVNEGHPPLFFNGDKKHWIDFLKMYFDFIKCNLIKDDFYFTDKNHDLCERFINDNAIQSFISTLTDQKISENFLNIVLFPVFRLSKSYILFQCFHNQKSISSQLNELIPKIKALMKAGQESDPGIFNEPFRSIEHIHDLSHRIHSSDEEVYLKGHTEELKEDRNLNQSFMNYASQFALPKAYTTCFTDTPKNDQMWNLYADKYNGICIQFTLNKDKTFPLNNSYMLIHPMNYPNKLKPYDYFKDMDYQNPIIHKYFNNISDGNVITERTRKAWLKAVDEKYKSWRYENEYRLITFGDYKNGIKEHFSCKSVKSVYLGFNVSEADQNEVIKILKATYTPIKLYKMYRLKDGSLEPKLLKNVNVSDDNWGHLD